jgi:hypothetical protein
MDRHSREYFSQFSDDFPKGNFHRVISLHDAPDIDWDILHKHVPCLSKGWYELVDLDNTDRIEFLKDFWLEKLPYRQGISEFIEGFFNNLDFVGIFITQKAFDAPFDAHIVYSLKENKGFYQGGPPVGEVDLQKLQKQFENVILPADYLAFLQIHDGFSKTTDSTGIICSSKFMEVYHSFQEMLQGEEVIKTSTGLEVDPGTLIPFYKSFGMPFFQCFWKDWYPEGEMGNVYYSGELKKILVQENGAAAEESLAFPTFLDWLKFYLERVD